MEHYFQAMKTIDIEERWKVIDANSAGDAKRLGRKLDLRKDWEEVKFDVMREALNFKFSDPYLKKLLLKTGDRELIEGNNWHDNIWGDCRCIGCKKITGENMLGILLMKKRSKLKRKLIHDF